MGIHSLSTFFTGFVRRAVWAIIILGARGAPVVMKMEFTAMRADDFTANGTLSAFQVAVI